MGSILSILIFLPVLAMLGVLFVPKKIKKQFQWIALGTSLVQLVLVLCLTSWYDTESATGGLLAGFQFEEKLQWMNFSMGDYGRFSVMYHLGLDGLSFSMLLLTSIVMVVATLSSWKVESKARSYFALLLLLNGAVVGCFVSLDLLLFYLFFEFMLLPMYFLIGLWGGPRRDYASIKFFLYTLLGSIFILIVMIALYSSVIDPAQTAVAMGLANSMDTVTPQHIAAVQQFLAEGSIDKSQLVHSFSIPAMCDAANFIPDSLLVIKGDVIACTDPRMIAFIIIFIGFAVKLPVVPVHTWLPDAHVEAPTPISVILAGVLLKVGGYGLLRIVYGVFPAEGREAAWWVALLGLISIMYGAYNALAQKDLKKLIAYSSVSHMGFVLMGIASYTIEGVTGAVYQMFSHGIISALLFLVAGVIYDRTHDRMIENYRGLAGKMPFYTAVVTIAFFASLGLPGFSGFIAEIFVFLGAFSSSLIPAWMVGVALIGIIIGAAYYLWTLQKMFFGEFWLIRTIKDPSVLRDLTAREYIMLVPLVLLAILYGVFPNTLLQYISSYVVDFVDFVN